MKQLLIAALLPASLIAANASAGEFFIGLNAGTSDFSGLGEACDDFRADNMQPGGLPVRCVVTEDSDTTLSINAGYNFNRVLGIEAGYTDLGEYSAELGISRFSVPVDAEVTFSYAALVLSAPFSDSFSASLRLGGVNADFEINSISLSGELEDEAAAFVGASLDYRITDAISVQVRYDDFDELSITSAGVRLHF